MLGKISKYFNNNLPESWMEWKVPAGNFCHYQLHYGSQVMTFFYFLFFYRFSEWFSFYYLWPSWIFADNLLSLFHKFYEVSLKWPFLILEEMKKRKLMQYKNEQKIYGILWAFKIVKKIYVIKIILKFYLSLCKHMHYTLHYLQGKGIM